MINLSEKQKQVVEAEIGIPMQVLASAGAGKTRVLTERIRRVLKETKKQGVIAFTFTNKAADEMQQRLDDVEDLSEHCWIATTHSVAQRILERYGHTIGLPSDLHIYEREQDRKSVFIQSLSNMGWNTDDFLGSENNEYSIKDRNIKIRNFMEQFSVVKRELLTDAEIEKRHEGTEGFLSIFYGYQDELLQSGGIDFDDILVYAHKILLEQPWCAEIYRAKYPHIFVDEAQDLNKAQYEFIKALCGEEIKSVMMVGDPNQMIYGFNGSSEEFLCDDFKKDFNPKTVTLRENYRSSKSIIALANKLKPDSQVVTQYALEGHSQISQFPSEKEEADWIASTIEGFLGKINNEIEGSISLSNFAVIASNRFVFPCLESALKEKNILYSVKKTERRSEPLSMFGKVLDFSVRLRLNSKDWIDGKKLFLLLEIPPPARWDDKEILNRLSEIVKTSDLKFSTLISSLINKVYELDVETPKVPKFSSYFEEEITLLAKVDGCSEDDMSELALSLEELADFKNCWTLFKKKGLGNSLSAFKNALALGQLNQDVDEAAGLTLSTVHTMKGLEKDIVFLMGMCEGVFPDYRSKSTKEISEERNKAFVAVTRARRWIYITYPLTRKMPWGDYKKQNPSRFIREMSN